MDIHSLVGFVLESCRFSKSSYVFEFCGKLNDEFRTFQVSTPFNCSGVLGDRTDAGEKISLEIWNCLEKVVQSVSVKTNKETTEVVFNFEGDAGFIIWSDEPLKDNLMIVRDQKTGEWFTVL